MGSLHIFLPESIFLSQLDQIELYSFIGLQGTLCGVIRIMFGLDLYSVFRSVHWVSTEVFMCPLIIIENLYMILQLQVD